jgi:tRNA-dihydrouridine synthase
MPAQTPVSLTEHLAFMLRHLDRMAGQYGEKAAPLLFRKWIPLYAKSLHIPRPQMVRILKLGKLEEVRKNLEDLRSPVNR